MKTRVLSALLVSFTITISLYDSSDADDRFPSPTTSNLERIEFNTRHLSASHPDDIYWDNSISPLDSERIVDTTVTALIEYDNKLIIGGRFDSVGGIEVNGIAAWDGTSWSALGSGLTPSHRFVYEFAVYDGKLIVLGGIDSAGGVDVNGIAAWDGTSWSSLGSGISGGVAEELAVYDGKLYVGGWFTSVDGVPAEYIASWDGTSWSEVGATAPSIDPISDLIVFNGKLVAAGFFVTGGGADTSYVATWDGTDWTAFDFPEIALEFAVYNNNLFCISDLLELHEWNGFNWIIHPLPDSIDLLAYPFVSALEYDGRLYIGGIAWVWDPERCIDYCQYSGVVWNGSNWSVFQRINHGDQVLDLATFQGHLFTGGRFRSPSTFFGYEYQFLTQGNGHWQDDISTTFQLPVYTLANYNGNLIVGGAIRIMDSIQFSNIGKWDGSEWTTLGSGTFGQPSGIGTVLALTLYDGKLIAGGWFLGAGGISANRIASWNDTSWSALGTGIGDNTIFTGVWALAEYNGNLIAAGQNISVAGGIPVNNIAQWDGTSWSALGSGLTPSYQAVTELAVYDGQLYAIGSFLMAGGTTVNKIASWDGTSWSSPNSGFHVTASSFPSALAVFDNKLIVAGNFDSVGGIAANHIAAWDGTSWSQFASGIVDPVRALYVYGGKLIATSKFPIGGGDTSSVAEWDGSTWTPLGSGTDRIVDAYQEYNGELAVGGWFNYAGGQPAAKLAMWTKPAFVCGDANNDGTGPNILDLNFLVNYIFRNGPPPANPAAADLNGSGGLPNILDLNLIVNYIFRNGPLPSC